MMYLGIFPTFLGTASQHPISLGQVWNFHSRKKLPRSLTYIAISQQLTRVYKLISSHNVCKFYYHNSNKYIAYITNWPLFQMIQPYCQEMMIQWNYCISKFTKQPYWILELANRQKFKVSEAKQQCNNYSQKRKFSFCLHSTILY